MMKRLLYIGICMLAAVTGSAQSIMDNQVTISHLEMARNENRLFISMDIHVDQMRLPADREVMLAPVLKQGEQSVRFASVLLAGRNRYYYHLRNNDLPLDYLTLHRSGKIKTIHYESSLPYSEWMKTATLVMDEDFCGCQCELLANTSEVLHSPKAPQQFRPQLVYLPPMAEKEKVREVRGSAYIDFPVSRTEINENYRRNPEELHKIRQTIETVKNDPDIRITQLSIKGYASPESPYENNARLAAGRTAALKQYVQRLYRFPDNVFITGYEPEDWEGLRRYVEASAIDNKMGILAIIDRTDLTPDVREWRLKSTYPQQYRYLLDNCYPALRHSDYVVEYVVRAYTSLDEIRQIFRTSPGKLSLQELYTLAAACQPGGEEYNEVFETMVRLYPADETANLNAANAAMARQDYTTAHKYLTKAGTSAHALYARGILAGLEKDYTAAKVLLQQSSQMGLKEAAEALKQLEGME